MKYLKLINPENATEEEVSNYKVREAVRAVVVDNEGKIALLHVVNENHYKLPGGGIEEGEDKTLALKRECKEEIGCDVEIGEEFCAIAEYRKLAQLKHTSYCYTAKVISNKGSLDLTDEEKERGSELVWMTYDEAIKAMSESNPHSLVCISYIAPRDFAILEESKSYLK